MTEPVRSQFWLGVGIVLVIYLICITASALVLLGVIWARWFLTLGAICNLLFAIAYLHVGRRFRVYDHILVLISVITLVLLLGRAVNIFHF